MKYQTSTTLRGRGRYMNQKIKVCGKDSIYFLLKIKLPVKLEKSLSATKDIQTTEQLKHILAY